MALQGQDILCQAKSGMGKTAVFVISILNQITPNDDHYEPHQAIITCHTRELAHQIFKDFKRLGNTFSTQAATSRSQNSASAATSAASRSRTTRQNSRTPPGPRTSSSARPAASTTSPSTSSSSSKRYFPGHSVQVLRDRRVRQGAGQPQDAGGHPGHLREDAAPQAGAHVQRHHA